jgi:hypothetical protein
VDANITNASIPVTGTVDVSTAAGSTVDVTGSTVSITAGQVVEVTNEPQGSLTVAGTVDIGTVTDTVTIDANGSAVTIDKLLSTFGLGHAVTNADSITFTPQPGTTGLIIVIPFPLGGSNALVSPTVTSGVGQVPHLVGNTSAVSVWEVGFITTQVTVSIPSAATWNVIEMTGPISWPPVGVVTFDVANPAGGFEWSFTAPFPGLLKRVSAQFVASSTVADRWPYLVTTQSASFGAYIPMASAAIVASATAHLGGTPGRPPQPIADPGPLGVQLFAFPDEVLPAGTTIQTVTWALQAGDQWSGIQLDLEPS